MPFRRSGPEARQSASCTQSEPAQGLNTLLGLDLHLRITRQGKCVPKPHTLKFGHHMQLRGAPGQAGVYNSCRPGRSNEIKAKSYLGTLDVPESDGPAGYDRVQTPTPLACAWQPAAMQAQRAIPRSRQGWPLARTARTGRSSQGFGPSGAQAASTPHLALQRQIWTASKPSSTECMHGCIQHFVVQPGAWGIRQAWLRTGGCTGEAAAWLNTRGCCQLASVWWHINSGQEQQN